MEKMGYEGKGPISKRKEGIIEPIQPVIMQAKDKTRLGHREESREETKQVVERILQLQASDAHETYSNEYEWDLLSEESCHDKEIDVVQNYTPIREEGQSLGYRLLEIGSQHIDDSSGGDQTQSEIYNLEESYLIDIDFAIGQS